MKQDFSRYFSKSSLSRRPIYQLVISGLTVLAVLAALGGGISVAAQYAGGYNTQPVATATPAPTQTPTPTPDASRKPDVVLYLSVSVVQQDIGVELYTLASGVEQSDTLTKGTTRVPVMGTEFVILMKNEAGENNEYTLDTSTGTLLVEDVDPGQYTVSVKKLAGYSMPDPESVTVSAKVEYKPDVAAVKDKIVQASAVVESAEDSGFSETPVAEELTDTVKWGESSTEEGEGSEEKDLKLSEDGYIVLEDGTISPYRPVKEGDTVVGAQRETQPQSGESPATPESAEQDPYAQWPDYIEAADFASYTFAFDVRTLVTYTYTGWQTLGGKTYYYDPDTHQPVTGRQVINGKMYEFSQDGVLKSSQRGIDVSKFQGSIDWSAVAEDGVSFAILRCGYRGYGTGALVEDSRFKENLRGAAANNIPVGIYFYSQAVNEAEAVEEASMVLSLVEGNYIAYPIFFDTEYVEGGRANSLSAAERTACAVAFCETIRSAGYTAGVYSYASYFYNSLNFSNISKYRIWIAQYRDNLSFSYNYNIWQYSSKGSVKGISGNVDMNLIP